MIEPTDERMYGDRADLYDRIYADKDYRQEAEHLRDLLHDYGVEPGARILEAACGTGRYLQYLDRWFDVSGFDLHPPMLEIAGDRLRDRDIELFQTDMAELEVETSFGAVVCLFASIAYLKTDAKLARTARRFYETVEPGGIVVVEPWLFPEQYITGQPSLHTYESDDLVISRQSVSKRRGNVSVLDLHWLVGRCDEDVEHFTETHELRMYTVREMLHAFSEAGFATRYDPDAYTTLFVAKRLQMS